MASRKRGASTQNRYPTLIMASNRRFVRQAPDRRRDAASVPPPLSSFSATPVTASREPLADQPRDPRSRLVMTKSGAVDVGNAIALGVGAAGPRCEGQIRARDCPGWKDPAVRRSASPACGRQGSRRSRRRAQPARRMRPRRNRLRCHRMARRGTRPRTSSTRVAVDRRGRQAVADHDRKPARPAAMRRQRTLRGFVQHSPEIGAPQIILAVAARDCGPRMAPDRAPRDPASGRRLSKAA